MGSKLHQTSSFKDVAIPTQKASKEKEKHGYDEWTTFANVLDLMNKEAQKKATTHARKDNCCNEVLLRGVHDELSDYWRCFGFLTTSTLTSFADSLGKALVVKRRMECMYDADDYADNADKDGMTDAM